MMAFLLALALAAEPPAEAVDHLALASVLLRDGHTDRAAAVLAEVDRAAEGLDTVRYCTLLGLVAFEQARYQDAVDHFAAARGAGAELAPVIWLFTAQAHAELGQHAEVIEALDLAGDAAASYPEAVLLRAAAHRHLEDLDAAWDTLQTGQRDFPDHLEITRRRVRLLVELGLYVHAAEIGAGLLERPEATVADHLAVAASFKEARAFDRAARFLEGARLRHPDEADLTLQLAQIYLAWDMPVAAADLLADLARVRPRYAVEAAEVYRRAGQLVSALMWNARVVDQVAKVRQRLGLMIELERFESAAAMAPRLSRLGLLDDDRIRYAVAYARFRIGEHAGAEQALRGLRDPATFEKAAELRKAILGCRAGDAPCE